VSRIQKEKEPKNPFRCSQPEPFWSWFVCCLFSLCVRSSLSSPPPLSVSVCLYSCIYLPRYISLSISLSFYLSISLSLSLSLPLSLPPTLSFYLVPFCHIFPPFLFSLSVPFLLFLFSFSVCSVATFAQS